MTKTKKFLRTLGVLLLVTALVVSLIPVSGVEAESSTSDFEIQGSTLYKYSGTAEVVSIPDEVRTIGEEAFAGNGNIVKVKINDKCKQIDYGAFANCVGLRTVEIGNGVESIDSAAFSNNKSLKNVSLGDSVKNIGSGAFAGDPVLTNLTVSENNPHLLIKDNVLYDDELKTLICMLPSYQNGIYETPSSLTEIEGYAFWGNTSIKNVTLNGNLYAVPEYAFSNCSNLKEVRIPLPVQSIDSKAFEDCVNLSLVTIPDSVSYIADNAFDGCPKLTVNATPGSYADTFSKNLKKSEVEEIEYEDVKESAVVSEETVNKYPLPEKFDGLDIEVVEGTPGPALPTADPKKEAKYQTGVINGYDVIELKPDNSSNQPTGKVLGSSPIVSGHALVFIDNKSKVISGAETPGVDLSISDNEPVENVETDSEPDDDNENVESVENSDTSPETEGEEEAKTVKDVLSSNASKGIDFPKFTIVGDKIASQSYYMDDTLENFEFPEDIKTIGDFAFARSSITSANIPEGITDIGYGAFYHCDNLSDVNIPSTVTSIGAYAFENTPFVDNCNDAFVIVGDGVLIAYKGKDSVVTIPEGVRLIADAAFKDNQGISAVNFATTTRIVGEDAFNGCTNLRTVNRTELITDIGANAFKNTKLSSVVIGPNVKSIGLGAFDLQGGTDTVIFEGTELPTVTQGTSASRLANVNDRTYAFGDMKNAIVQDGVNNLQGTVLEPGAYGFKGLVQNSVGNIVSDNTSGVTRYDSAGINVDCNSAMIDATQVSATMAGDDGTYILHITDSQNAKEDINKAYGDLYGGKSPDNLIGIDISLYDDSNQVMLKKLGKQYVTVNMAIPANINKDNMHVVALDEDGQLEAVEFTVSEDGESIMMKCKHFSPYGFYNSDLSNSSVEKTGDRVKDNTPDTGDDSIHPKWFLVVGCIFAALALFLITMKKEEAN